MAPSTKKSIKWEAHRTKIEDLYWTQDKGLTEVMEQMKKDHGIQATRKMYKRQILAWDLGKNIKKHEMIAMLRIEERRRKENKETGFLFRGKVVDRAKLRRFTTRYKLKPPFDDDDDDEFNASQDIPPHITYSTPEPETPRLPMPSKTEQAIPSPVVSENNTTNSESPQGSPSNLGYQVPGDTNEDTSSWEASSPPRWGVGTAYQALDSASTHRISADLPLFSPYQTPYTPELEQAALPSLFPATPWTGQQSHSDPELYLHSEAHAASSLTQQNSEGYGPVQMEGTFYHEGQNVNHEDHVLQHGYSQGYAIPSTIPLGNTQDANSFYVSPGGVWGLSHPQFNDASISNNNNNNNTNNGLVSALWAEDAGWTPRVSSQYYPHEPR